MESILALQSVERCWAVMISNHESRNDNALSLGHGFAKKVRQEERIIPGALSATMTQNAIHRAAAIRSIPSNAPRGRTMAPAGA
jgi:hypothetical protein